MGWRHDLNGHKVRHETSRTCFKMLRWWFRMVSTSGFLLARDSDRVPFAAGRLPRVGHRSCDDGGAGTGPGAPQL